MILAKSVVPDRYWILRQHDRKIGNIEAEPGGFVVSINGQRRHYDDMNLLLHSIPVQFDKHQNPEPPTDACQVHGYPTSSPAHNPVFDVVHQLPLWTQEPRSRSLMAAGWYRVRPHRNWKVMFCPKLILLQRYPFQGPFHSREEAMSG